MPKLGYLLIVTLVAIVIFAMALVLIHLGDAPLALRPRTTSLHIAGLYILDEDGSMKFDCTAFPVLHVKDTYTALTAQHCVKDEMPIYIAFDDDAPTFHLCKIGKTGEDFAAVTYTDMVDRDLYDLGDENVLVRGEVVSALTDALGEGESYYTGVIVTTGLSRPLIINEKHKDNTRYFKIQMPTYPGASGSPVLKDGKVVGIITASEEGTTMALKISVVKSSGAVDPSTHPAKGK